jgi:transcriptional regulator with XRE-family HTH domain
MTHPLESLFAKRLRDERVRAGFSQTELAKRLTELVGYTVDGSSITRIEKEKRGVRLVEAIEIAEVLGLQLHELVEDRDDVDGKLDGLRQDLFMAKYEADAIEDNLQRARDSVTAIEERIAALEAAQRKNE